MSKGVATAVPLAVASALVVWIFLKVGPAMGVIFGLVAVLMIGLALWGKGGPRRDEEDDLYVGEPELDLFDPRRAVRDHLAESAQEGWRESWRSKAH